MSLLDELNEPMQQFAEVLKSALKLEVDIFDNQLVRVAGTGLTKNKIGQKIDPHGIVNKYIYNGKNKIIIHEPGQEDKCKGCNNYGNCIYKKAVYASIKYNDETVGAMGIFALDDYQKQELESNIDAMLDFADKIAELIGSKITDHIIKKSLKERSIVSENDLTLDHIIGESHAINQLKDKIRMIAKGQSTILLTGETGTGKEMFSRGIHASSLRHKEPFIAINCGAIPENLIESELFGYESGAFTGARKDGKHGKFYLANKGTIFLDEVENMPLYMQQKLLRVIENREVEPLGSNEPIHVDIRIIAASNKNLEEMISQGTFREDLYHRLNVVLLDIPALRNRGNDTLVLSNFFVNHYNRLLNKAITSISPEVEKIFLTYPWPGNVRELQNVIEYAINMETEHVITLANIPDRVKSISSSNNTLTMLEKNCIKKTIDQFGWTDEGKTLAAKALGISRSTIYRKIGKYNLTQD